MKPDPYFWLVVAVTLLVSGCRHARESQTVFQAAFPVANTEQHGLTIPRGRWASPLFPVTPFQLYRLDFDSKADRPGFWFVRFFGSTGQEITADLYSRVAVSSGWTHTTSCFFGRAGARVASVGFQPLGAALNIDSVRISNCSREQALRHIDEVYAAVPPLKNQPPAPLQNLPCTMDALRRGGNLRVVMLGDSIANDVGNSLFTLLVERNYPGTHIELILSVRSSTGCTFYRKDEELKRYVLDQKPDLVIISGISHHDDSNAVLEVIQKTRAVLPQTEFLVTDGAVDPSSGNAAEQAFFSRLAEAGSIEGFATLDLRAAWNGYLAASGKPLNWFQRDAIHSNDYGKQVLGRILADAFGSRSP